MQRLVEGVHRFRHEEFGEYRELLRRLAEQGQEPHTLFIACSDSRVLPELFTNSGPGELFVVRNVGNIVPPYDQPNAPYATGSAIEYAVGVLQVSDVVVCGHTGCGAMKALMDGLHGHEDLKHLARWIELAAPVRDEVRRSHGTLPSDQQCEAAEEENVLFALENLETYPVVAEALSAGTLRLHGWIFEIGTGELSVFDSASGQFEPLHATGRQQES